MIHRRRRKQINLGSYFIYAVLILIGATAAYFLLKYTAPLVNAVSSGAVITLNTLGSTLAGSDVLIFLILAIMAGLFVYRSRVKGFLRSKDIPVDKINAMLPEHLREKPKQKKIKHEPIAIKHKKPKAVRRKHKRIPGRREILSKLKKRHELKEKVEEPMTSHASSKIKDETMEKIRKQIPFTSKKPKKIKKKVKKSVKTQKIIKKSKIKEKPKYKTYKKQKIKQMPQRIRVKPKNKIFKRTKTPKLTKMIAPPEPKKEMTKRIRMKPKNKILQNTRKTQKPKIEKTPAVLMAPPEPKREHTENKFSGARKKIGQFSAPKKRSFLGHRAKLSGKPKLPPEEIRRQKRINKIKLIKRTQREYISPHEPIKKAHRHQPKEEPAVQKEKIQPNSIAAFYRLQKMYAKQKKKEEDEKENIKETFK